MTKGGYERTLDFQISQVLIIQVGFCRLLITAIYNNNSAITQHTSSTKFKNMKIKPCQSEKELDQYWELARKTKYLGEPGIYEKTGCRATCDVTRYEMRKRYQTKIFPGKDKVRN